MPAIDFVPVMKPIAPEELVGRLQRGWRMEGQALLQQGSGVVTPDNPTGQSAIPVNVWILPEPMVPLGELISTLLALDASVHTELGQVTAAVALDNLAQAIVGTTIEQLRQATEENQNVHDTGAISNKDSGDNAPPEGIHLPGWVQ